MENNGTGGKKAMKGLLSGMLRLGKGSSMVVGLAVMFALTVGVASEALAGRNAVPTLKLGVQNAVRAITSVAGSVAGPVLRLDNNGAGPALDLQVEPGQAPMTVSSDVKVGNLNADKIDGKDSSEFLAAGQKAGDAELLDGKDSADFARAYKRTVVVGPVGSAVENGTALRNALNGISGASQDNPYLLKVEPGVYDLGNGTLNMRSFVDIDGSGEQVTKITASGAAGSDHNTLTGANNAELRFLTVENTGGGAYATAIRNDHGSPSITHVTARASGGTSGSRGIVNASSAPTLSDVTVQATGEVGKKSGIQNYNSTVTISGTDVAVTGAGGEKRGIESNDGVGGNDTLTLSNVSVSVSEGSGAHHGITTFDYQVRATDVRVNVTGGGTNQGVSTRDGVGGWDLLTFQEATFSVSGGSTNTGILQNDTDTEISNSRIEADGGTSVGVKVVEPGVGKQSDSRIDNTVIRGATNTVQTSGGTNVRIGASRLVGGAASGVSACAGVYDENYAFSANTCP